MELQCTVGEFGHAPRQGLHCRCDTIARSPGDHTGSVRLKEKWELEDKGAYHNERVLSV